jgi:hypothetical protein
MVVGGKGQHGSATTSWAPYLGPREIAAAVEIMTSKLCAIEISDLNWTGLDCIALLSLSQLVPTSADPDLWPWNRNRPGLPKLWGSTPDKGDALIH